MEGVSCRGRLRHRGVRGNPILSEGRDVRSHQPDASRCCVGAGEYCRRLGAGGRARVPAVPQHRIRVACRGGLLHSLGEAAWLHPGRPGNPSGCAPQRAQPDAEWPDEVLPAPRLPSSRRKTQDSGLSGRPPPSPLELRRRPWSCDAAPGAATSPLELRRRPSSCDVPPAQWSWASGHEPSRHSTFSTRKSNGCPHA